MPLYPALTNSIIDAFLRGRPWEPASAYYLALFTADPAEQGLAAEVSAASYARVQIVPGPDNWTTTQGTTGDIPSTGDTGSTTNAVELVFPTPGEDWGEVTHVALLTAPAGGELLVSGALSAPVTITAGSGAPRFNPGTLSLTLT